MISSAALSLAFLFLFLEDLANGALGIGMTDMFATVLPCDAAAVFEFCGWLHSSYHIRSESHTYYATHQKSVSNLRLPVVLASDTSVLFPVRG
jgi:hypothetical protein